MYAKGMITCQISDTLMNIYGFKASEGFILDVTDKLPSQIEWQNRSLDELYPVLFIDAIRYYVLHNGSKELSNSSHSRWEGEYC